MTEKISSLDARKFEIAEKLIAAKIWTNDTGIAFMENTTTRIGTVEAMEKMIAKMEEESK